MARTTIWMHTLFGGRSPGRGGAGFTLTYAVRGVDGERVQTRMATERYVATVTGSAIEIFDPERQARYAVDAVRRRLVPAAVEAVPAALQPLQSSLGRICAVFDERPELIEGRWCTRRTVYNEGGRVVAVSTSYFSSLPGLERTALQQEHVHAYRVDPLALPPNPDEMEVLSSRRLLAADYQDSRTVRLIAVQPQVADPASFDAFLRYPVAA